jgi:hypothetical protein
MRNTHGAFEIGVMPVLPADPMSEGEPEAVEMFWTPLIALLVQIYACLGQAH